MEYKKPLEPDVIIVEDSNSGYEFFKHAIEGKGWKIVSAGGKSNIFRELGLCKESKVLVIADGAAFGPEMDRVMKRMSLSGDKVLYLPESFEWLVLKAGVIKDSDIAKILEEPSEYVESEKYMSWEKFFTTLLIERTQDSYLKYEKQKLNATYKNEKIVEKIMSEIPKGLI